MMNCNCNCNCNVRCSCTTAALIAAIAAAVIGAFLQITGRITVTAGALTAALIVALAALGILALGALARRQNDSTCLCRGLNGVLIGILGTIALSIALLALGITATSLLSALAVGTLVGTFTIMIASAACLIRCILGCEA